jgi:hypothetical protein
MTRISLISLVSLVGSVLCAGCGGPEGTVRVDAALAKSEALLKAAQVGTTLELPTGAGSLIVERVRIAVSEVELEGEEEDGEEFEMGERVVEVALDGAPTEVVAQAVPEGSYQELGMELMVGGFDELGGDEPASILVEGTYDGAPFTYRSTVAPELEFNLGKAAEVRQGGEARIAVTFDVAAWFLSGDTALNPTDPVNRQTIESNILSSMAAHAEVELGDDD